MNQVIANRNDMLILFFTEKGYNVKLYGNLNQPNVILDETYLLPCYVHNYKLNFCDKKHGGDVLFWTNLNQGNKYIEYKYDLDQWINDSELRMVNMIVKDKTGEIFSGFDHASNPLWNGDVKYYFNDDLLNNDLLLINKKVKVASIINGKDKSIKYSN